MTTTMPLMYRDHALSERPATPATRVMVVYPGHQFSTRDVADNVVAGLRGCGVEVAAFHYHEFIEALLPLEKLLQDQGVADATEQVLVTASNALFPRAMAFHPDLILFVTGYVFPQAGANLLGVYTRTAVILTESPYQWEAEARVASGFNWAFTNERRSVEAFRRLRADYHHPHPERVHYLPHGYDPARHVPRAVGAEYASDVCFIGSPFPERQALFGAVDWTGIDLRVFGLWTDPDDVRTIHEAGGFVDNEEAHRWYAGAVIVVGHHRSIRYFGRAETIASGDAESLNPRVYELAAAGRFQVCDDSRPELTEIFGWSVPTYRADDPADLERVLRWFLAHPEERARCAAEARRRVAGHDCVTRMRGVLDTVFGYDGWARVRPDDITGGA